MCTNRVRDARTRLSVNNVDLDVYTITRSHYPYYIMLQGSSGDFWGLWLI